MGSKAMKEMDDLEKEFAEIKAKAQELEKKAISDAKIDQGQEELIRDRLYRMIDYAINRHDWYDDQRYRFLQIGLALMAAGAALLSAFAALSKTLMISTYVFFCLLGIGISVFLTGLSLVYLYNQGVARNHPYRKIVDISSWYFAYNFPSGLSDHLSSSRDIAKKQVQESFECLEKFFDRWLQLAKERQGFLKEDLEQAFILLLIQRYRYQQVKKMSSTLFLGMKVATLLILLTLVVFFFSDINSSDNDVIKLNNSNNPNNSNIDLDQYLVIVTNYNNSNETDKFVQRVLGQMKAILDNESIQAS